MLTLAEIGRQRQANLVAILKITFITLLKNPLFLSVMIGMSCAVFNIQIPQLLDSVFAMLGQTASPLALFIIGGEWWGSLFNPLICKPFILWSQKIFVCRSWSIWALPILRT